MQCEGRRVNFSTYNYYNSNSRNLGPIKSTCKITIKVRCRRVCRRGYDKKRASPIHAMARVRQVITRRLEKTLAELRADLLQGPSYNLLIQ